MRVLQRTLDDHQVLGAERGFDPDGEPTLADPPRPLEIEPAFCTHAMAASYRDPKQVFLVADANKDWRFARNPYSTKNGGGVSFYAAANVNLPVEDNEKRGLPSTLASGALCLMDGTKTLRDPSEFSEEDRAVLSDLAEMIARECESRACTLGWTRKLTALPTLQFNSVLNNEEERKNRSNQNSSANYFNKPSFNLFNLDTCERRIQTRLQARTLAVHHHSTVSIRKKEEN